MEIQQLIYFAKIAELQNITKAARELYISQPALSKSIRHLEEEMDVQLFCRQGKNIQLTSAGKVFYNKVSGILHSLNSAQREINDLANPSSLPVRLKLRALSGLLPDIIADFLQKHPDTSFSISSGGELSFSVSDYDLIIFSSAAKTESRSSLRLFQEEICLFTSSDHLLAKKESCTFEELKDQPFLFPSKSRFFYETLQDYFEKTGFAPSTLIECNDVNIIVDLIRKGCGISLLPEYSLSTQALTGIQMIPIREPVMHRSVYIAWPDGAYIPKAAREFRSFLLHYFED